MNTKYMVIVAAMAVMLIGATALATQDAFAGNKNKIEYNQVRLHLFLQLQFRQERY
jgi:hypothetical protein